MQELEKLMQACRYGNISQIETILTANPMIVHDENDRGVIPFIMAVTSNQMRAAEFLLTKGAYIDGRDSEWRTALIVAAKKGFPEQIKFLIERGADPNAQDLNGVTPLAVATKAKRAYIVEMLLKAGADMDMTDNNGVSPKDLAEKTAEEEVLKAMGMA